MNRFQILKGLPPPSPKKVTPQHHYYYGVDWGPRPENTAIAICHKENKTCVFDYVRLMSESNHANLRECLDCLDTIFPIKRLTVDVGPYRENLTGFGYNQVRCTEEMGMILRNAISNGHVAIYHKNPLLLGWSELKNEHTMDAMSVAFWSIYTVEILRV